jgi:hypothetical protein
VLLLHTVPLLLVENKETPMFYAITWFVVLSLLALWSLAAWAFHAVAAWTVTNAGVLAGGAGVSMGWRLPDWLSPWVPAELAAALAATAQALAPAVKAMLDWAPSLAGVLSVGVWVIWAVGGALLVGLGILASGLIAVLRRRST